MEGYKYKALAGFKLMTCRFVVNALTHCATLLGNNFLKGNNYMYNILHFLLIAVGPYKKLVTVGSCPYKVKGRENRERIRIFIEIRYGLEYACKSWNLIEDHGTLLAYRHSGILVNTEPNQYWVKDRQSRNSPQRPLPSTYNSQAHHNEVWTGFTIFVRKKKGVRSITFP